jgi:ubiquinone/menaquinone biosynthesis C-methylase UbiE
MPLFMRAITRTITRKESTAPFRHRLTAIATAALLPLATGCHVLSRLDYSQIATRKGWQHTDRVIESLELAPGDVVADLGAGDGYFSFPLADAVGPTGRVYAVEIDPDKLEALRREVTARGYENIEVVEGTVEDPGLPNAGVDLVFFCNAYHHFENRIAYLERLRVDLKPAARIAVVDGKPEGSLFIPEGHVLEEGVLVGELADARFAHVAAFDFLPMQSFDVFVMQ